MSMRMVRVMNNEEYIRAKCDFNWSFEERKQKIEDVLLDCPIQAGIYARVLSTDAYRFTLKRKSVQGRRVLYLHVEYPE